MRIDSEAVARRIAEVAAEAARHPAGHPHVHATSSQTGAGIAELRAALAGLATFG